MLKTHACIKVNTELFGDEILFEVIISLYGEQYNRMIVFERVGGDTSFVAKAASLRNDSLAGKAGLTGWHLDNDAKDIPSIINFFEAEGFEKTKDVSIPKQAFNNASWFIANKNKGRSI